jgi:acyl-CoA reductase-like NAD-dependent aldehyde dehydrogenase
MSKYSKFMFDKEFEPGYSAIESDASKGDAEAVEPLLYSQADLEAAKTEAEAKGVAVGIEQAQRETQHQASQLLGAIIRLLGEIEGRQRKGIEQARRDGGKMLIGGRRLTEGAFQYGFFVEPTIIDGLPATHPLFEEELFVPITVVADVLTLEEAIELANRTEYGLTAGIFSEDDREIEQFFNRVQAGVLYANRRAGATTGAWPGINPFGGWKASGSSGRGSGGPYYVQQFFREQSRVRIY